MLPAAMRLGETPVLIPNTTVKTQEADGTALETVWESRWPPALKKEKRSPEGRQKVAETLLRRAYSSAG